MKEIPEKDNNTMNPQIVENFEVGSRHLRFITIYPLSMGDQIKLEKVIEKALQDYYAENPDGGEVINFVNMLVTLIKDNLSSILRFVTDLEDSELIDVGSSFSNFQATALAKLIYEMNYLDPYEKNLKSLPLMDKLSQLVGQSPSSLENTLNTESKISTGSPLEKEDLPQDNSTSSSPRARRKS